MSKQMRTAIFTLFLTVSVAMSGFAQTDLKDLQQGVAGFSKDIANALPLYSSLGLNWSSAYIGKLIPSVPPHFGVGGSFGFTTMEIPAIKTLTRYLGYDLPFGASKMFLPAYTVEARAGGFFLPFDVGFKFGYLPQVDLWGTSLHTDYLLIGGDIRYAILDKPVLPKISLGVGFNYLKAGLGAKVGNDVTLRYGSHVIGLERPDIGLRWESYSLDFKAQISHSFLIITPYAGVGGSYAWSEAGYEVTSHITHDGNPLNPANITDIDSYLKGAGVDGINVNESGISSIIKDNAFSFRAFGGLSFNVTLLKIDLTVLYSFRDGNFGGSLGMRFQL